MIRPILLFQVVLEAVQRCWSVAKKKEWHEEVQTLRKEVLIHLTLGFRMHNLEI